MGCTKDIEPVEEPSAGRVVEKPAPTPTPTPTPHTIDAGVPDAANTCRVKSQLREVAMTLDLDDSAVNAWVDARAAALLPAAGADAAVGTLAADAIAALEARDFHRLARLTSKRGLCLKAAKGAACRWMKTDELRRCKRSRKREEWAVDTGADHGPRLACAAAFEKIWLLNPNVLDAAPAFNCFADRPDNNATTIVGNDPDGTIYVEYYADEVEPTRDGRGWKPWTSMWLVFSPEEGGYALTQLVSHYWGI